MSDRQRALLSFLIGCVCTLSAIHQPFGAEAALGLVIGIGNLLAAALLLREAA